MDRRRRLKPSIPVTGVAARAERGSRDGTVTKIESATRETCPVRGRGPQPDCIRMKPKTEWGWSQESEEFIVAMKRLIPAERRDSGCFTLGMKRSMEAIECRKAI